MANRESLLQVVEQELHADLEVAQTPQDGAEALAKLSLVHLRMGEYRQSVHELWASMHGRSTVANIATVATALGYLSNPNIDPLAAEHHTLRRQS